MQFFPRQPIQFEGRAIVGVPKGSDCVFLAHADGANGSTSFSNVAGSLGTATVVGSAQVSTAQSKFGGASALFDGTTDALRWASHADWGFGTGDFTADLWLYMSANNRNQNPLLVTSGFQIELTSGNVLTISQFGVTVIATYDLDLISIGTGQWFHVAVTRAGTALKVFVNGVLRASATNSTNFPAGALTVGAIHDDTRSWQGYIDEVRMRKGTAEWTADFTPPARPYF